MRKFAILSALLIFYLSASGQILNPVNWEFSSKQINDSEYDLLFTAHIDEGWTVYSQYLESDDGPVATSFAFDQKPHFSLVGKNVETSDHRKEMNDPLFDNMRVIKFSEKVTFTQRVKVSGTSQPITGYLEFMTCDNARCLPPAEVDFSFELKPAAAATANSAAKQDVRTSAPEATTQSTDGAASEAPAWTAATGGINNGIENPVTWSLTVEKNSDREYTLAYKATLEKGWYIYSQFLDEGGPEPTEFVLDESDNVEAAGKVAEQSGHKVEGYDPMFDMNITKYKGEAVFTQKITVQDASQHVSGYVYFMTCDDTKCLPPAEVPFKVTPATLTALIGEEAAGKPAAATGSYASIGIDKSTAADCGQVATGSETKKGLWSIFILGFLGGLVALLTPCVFPMIPLTVSFFTKGNKNKSKGLFNAFMYGFFILLVYLLLSVPFHLLDSVNPDILNEISTNVWLNIIFFLIFLVFAFSFFGYFELTLPSSWTNKASAAEGIGGLLGIFFMALTLALVSFSCTGPILGSLLAGALSAEGGAVQLTAGMGGFGLALALPFGLFAAFPSWLNSLPKSGGWMTTVKVVLGFLELALALKFLSNADLVKHWGLLKIEPFLALWFAIFVGLGLYLLGKIRFPHDSPMKKIPVARWVLGLASFGFAIYLATGFIYDGKAGSLKPLKLLSGLAPPTCYSWFYPCDCPQNLNCFKDFDEGLAYAQETNKPIMIDFTGHACVNCRKMEEHVWPTQEVYKYLKDDFVLISLYVDEKIDLPEVEQKTVPMKSGGTRKLRTTGHKWQYLQTENFNNNSQPYYVLLSPDGKMLNHPVGYTPESSEYADFLECGLQKFNDLEAEKKLLGAKE
jgi:thiol:disulfide interchange protein